MIEFCHGWIPKNQIDIGACTSPSLAQVKDAGPAGSSRRQAGVSGEYYFLREALGLFFRFYQPGLPRLVNQV